MSVELQAIHDDALEPDYEQYRALSAQAVGSAALGVLSLANLLSYDYGPVVALFPILGLVLGLRAWWNISHRPLELTGKPLAQVGAVLSLGFLLSGWALHAYVYATEVPEGYQRISYADLQPNPLDPNEVIPPSALELDGKRVFIKGYVYPGAQRAGIKQFILCRDNGDCCFGGNPKLTDMILVTLKDPLRLTYSDRVQRLAGTFRVQQGEGVDGLSNVVYQLEADYLAQ